MTLLTNLYIILIYNAIFTNKLRYAKNVWIFGSSRNFKITNGWLLQVLTSSGQHVYPEGWGRSGRVFKTGSDLSLVSVLPVLHCEHVHSVRCHLLLGDQDLKNWVKNVFPIFSKLSTVWSSVLMMFVKKTQFTNGQKLKCELNEFGRFTFSDPLMMK